MNHVVLLSGGLDSALCALMARDEVGEVSALFFNYGQAHRQAEQERAVAFADRLGIDLTVIDLPRLAKSDDVVFVGRNLLMLATAVPFAAAKGAEWIWIGSNWSDSEHFPDCRPEFVRAAGVALDAYGLHLRAPLLNLTKAQVVKELRRRGEDAGRFWSCYAPQDGEPCGGCMACRVRKDAGA
jgi:7-cyano-7-deazaguanine synthase